MTLGRKRSKEKVGVNGEIRSGWGEGHGEGSQKREMSLAERWCGWARKAPTRAAHYVCLKRAFQPESQHPGWQVPADAPGLACGQSYLCSCPSLSTGVGHLDEHYLCAMWLHGGPLESPELPGLTAHFLPVI